MRNFFKILAVVILISWFAGFVFFADAINSYPEDHTTRTEAIIALTGGRNRIAEAFRLLDEGKSDRLFISGVSKHSSLAGIKHRNHITGGDDEAVSLGREATNTVENAIETSHWLKENNIKSIRLVTSNYHVPPNSKFKIRSSKSSSTPSIRKKSAKNGGRVGRHSRLFSQNIISFYMFTFEVIYKQGAANALFAFIHF